MQVPPVGNGFDVGNVGRGPDPNVLKQFDDLCSQLETCQSDDKMKEIAGQIDSFLKNKNTGGGLEAWTREECGDTSIYPGSGKASNQAVKEEFQYHCKVFEDYYNSCLHSPSNPYTPAVNYFESMKQSVTELRNQVHGIWYYGQGGGPMSFPSGQISAFLDRLGKIDPKDWDNSNAFNNLFNDVKTYVLTHKYQIIEQAEIYGHKDGAAFYTALYERVVTPYPQEDIFPGMYNDLTQELHDVASLLSLPV